MQHEHVTWMSPALSRPMGIEIFGHGGARVIVFPTTMGNCYEWRDRRMPQVLGDCLDNGWVQLFCVDQVHSESWYNRQIHPGARAWRHLQYDRYLVDEVLPFSGSRNPNPFVIATGASFGAYHAASFGLRHPEVVHRIIGMSGLYDIKQLTDGFSDDNVYRANPADFMKHEQNPGRLAAFRRQDIILAVGRDDPNYVSNTDLSTTLWNQGIGNALRVWDGWSHDWPYWERMIRLYLPGHD